LKINQVDIYQDREGVLWIGTFGGGLDQLITGDVSFSNYQHNPTNPNSLSNNNVRGIYEDQVGILWIGSDGGLDEFNPLTGEWKSHKNDPGNPDSLSENIVASILEDKNGLLWIGTREGGVNKYDKETRQFTHYLHDPESPNSLSNNQALSLLEDNDSVLWIGTADGLNKFNPDSNDFTRYINNPDDPQSLSPGAVLIIYQDQVGVLWVGTTGGLNKFDPETQTFTRYLQDPDDPQSISHNIVTSIHEDQKGVLWIGTLSGLNRMDRSAGTFDHYRESDGLPNDIIYGFLEDGQGNLWLSTNHGLSHFNPETESFRNYDVLDGLQSNEFNSFSYFQGSNRQMFFGGINGFNSFYPDELRDNIIVPPIVLTSFTQNGEPIDIPLSTSSPTPVTLSWPKNFFEFEFAALSFSQPEKNQYAYILEGFDENWNEIGTRNYGKYTNLPGGTYTLRMRGSNNDGVWNKDGYALDIKIIPPLWETWWFWGIILLVLLGGAFGGYRLRVRNLETRSRELESQVEQRTAELMQIEENLKQSEMEKAITEERNRLARDLHDSVTQSIYSLTLLAEAGQRMIKSGDLQQAKGNQSRLGDISQQALQEMRLLVYELRPQVLRSEGLLGALEQRLEVVERRAGINARLVMEVEIELPADLEGELYHISMEALNNALKHTKASEVVLSLRADEDNLTLELKDNGQGFDQEIARVKGGMGLTSMGERADNIGGKLTIQSELGVGTTVRIIVPFMSPKDSAIDSQVSTDHQEVPS